MNAMDQLKDIHLPQEVGLWPLAWGWWALIVIALTLTTFATVVLIRRHKKRLAVRQAVKAIEALDSDTQHWPQQLNTLLKRAAMVYLPQGTVEHLHSEQWQAFLVNALPQNKRQEAERCFSSLQESLYRKETQLPEFADARVQAIQWVKHALPPSKTLLQEVGNV